MNIRLILFIFLSIPISLFAIVKTDTIVLLQNQLIQQIKINENNSEKNNRDLKELINKFKTQENINEKTINGITTQLNAASYNLTMFGILFAIAAILLGIYITRIENKVVRIKEESESLLKQTEASKEEVIEINNLIQKDIYGLYLRIRREETIHLLKRLLEVPEDVTNLIEQIVSRDLEAEDFPLLKEAYMKIKDLPEEPEPPLSLSIPKKELYNLIFFQHFCDLAILDKEIKDDLLDFFPKGINSSFKNDIIKSTQDFMKAIVYLGFQSLYKEINIFFKAISSSKYKDFDDVYEIIFNALKNRNDQFLFFNLISDEKDSQVGVINFGKLLIHNYSSSEKTPNEKEIFKKLDFIKAK